MAYALYQATFFLFVSQSCLGQIQLDDYIPPKITFPNMAQDTFYFKKDSAINLTCRSNGKPAPIFRWLQNDIDIDPSSNISYNPHTGDLLIPRVSEWNLTFRCIATSQYQQAPISTRSPKVHLYQLHLAKLGTNREMLTVTEHQYLSLPCGDTTRHVAPKINYRWFKSYPDSVLPLGAGRLFIDGEGTLHFTHLYLSDEMLTDYTCLMWTILNTTELGKQYSVRVLAATDHSAVAPKLEYSNTPQLAMINSTATLECVHSGFSRTSIMFDQWWASADNVTYTNNSKYTISYDGRQMFVHNLQEDDEKSYFCGAKNEAGEVTSAVYLDVMSVVTFGNGQPQDQTKLENSSAEFVCDAKSIKGEAAPGEPIWFVNSLLLGTNYDRGKYSISDSNKKLTVLNLRKPDDIMCIQCEVGNNRGTTQGTACLNVLIPLTVTRKPPPSQEIEHGVIIDLTVMVTSDPTLQLSYRWSTPNGNFDEENIPYFLSWNPTIQEAFIDTNVMRYMDYLKLKGNYTITVFTQLQSITVETQVLVVENNMTEEEKPYPTPTPTSTVMPKSKPEDETNPWWLYLLFLVATAVVLLGLLLVCLAARRSAKKAPEDERRSPLQEEKYIDTLDMDDTEVTGTEV